jgi:hypothetical protein
MTFLSLSYTQALLLLLATVAGIFVLYWLKPPPQRVVVPSTLIWRRVLKERKRRSDFWRWLVSLAIALTVGLAIASSVGKPELEALSGRARRMALVIDDSPTMGARMASGETRWARAKEVAGHLLQEGSAGSQFLLADTAGQLVSVGFADRRAALEALDSLRLSTRENTAFPSGDPFEHLDGQTEVYFVTDGVMVRSVPEGVTTIPVFEPVDNVGITAFDLRPLPSEPTRYEAFLEIQNRSAVAKRVAIQVDGAGGEPISRALQLAPGQVSGETLELDSFLAGPVRALVDAPNDGFALDNVAYGYLGIPRRVRGLLVTEGNEYLETSLGLDPRVALGTVSSNALPVDETPDFYVFDRFAPEEPPDAPALVFRPTPVAWLPPYTGAELTNLAIRVVDGEHPIMSHVSFTDVFVERALSVAPRQGRVVAGTPDEPLVIVGERPRRWIEVTFDLGSSNLPIQTSFPIFLSNAVNWLTGKDVLATSLGPLVVPIEHAKVTDVSGRDVATKFVGDKTTFSPDSPGLFTVRGASGPLIVVANLTSPRVSGVSDSVLGEAGTSSEPPGNLASSVSGTELWRWLVLVALALLVVEWWTYHRRMTV